MKNTALIDNQLLVLILNIYLSICFGFKSNNCVSDEIAGQVFITVE